MVEHPAGMPTLSVVAPVFNEEASIAAFVEQTVGVLAGMDVEYELVLVNDGSTDGTARELETLARGFRNVRTISLSRNFGHQAAITAGVFEALGQAVVVMDSDLQDPPELIPDLVQAWRDGADVAYAVRRAREGETFFKRVTASAFYRVLRSMSDTDIPADTGDYRLMSREVVEALRLLPEKDRFMRGLVAWVGFKQVPVYFDRRERYAGKTKYSIARMLKLGSSGLVGFSDKPLYLTVATGFVVMGLALVGLVYVLLSLIFGWGDLVRGWASVVVIVMFFSAVQLIFLGVVGIYVSRIFVEVKHRPSYVIRSRD